MNSTVDDNSVHFTWRRNWSLSCYDSFYPSVAAKAAYDAAVTRELANLANAKAELMALLKTLLMGDALAAEYLLCHLISSVHRWGSAYSRRKLM